MVMENIFIQIKMFMKDIGMGIKKYANVYFN